MKYNGHVDELGKLHVIHEKMFKDDLKKEFARPGKKTKVEIQVTKKKVIRTLSQNAYYWGVVMVEIRDRLRELSGERWISKEDAHDFMMNKVHYIEIVDEETGLVERIKKETHNLGKGEFAEMVEKVREWAEMFLNVTVPDPDSQAEMFMEE